MKIKLSVILGLLVLARLAPGCAAQDTYEWTNGNISNGTAMLWNDPLNWTSETGTNFPNAGDTAELGPADSTPIPNSGTINLDANLTAATILLNGNFDLEAVGPGAPNSIQFNLTGNGVAGPGEVTLGGGALLFSLSGNNNAFNGTMTVASGANVTFSGSVNAGNGNVDLENGVVTFTNNATGASTHFTVANSTTLYFMDNATVGGTATVNSTGHLSFNNNATAGGSSTVITSEGSINFHDSSTAALATIHLDDEDGTLGYNSTMQFNDTSNAGYANISGNGLISFNGSSNAAFANITSNSELGFFDSSSAGNATVSNNNLLGFFNSSTGGNAAVTTGSGASTDISMLSTSGTTLGSIAGAGNYSLGSKNLAVGSANTNTTVTGSLQDGGLGGGTAGSLTKVGTGVLTLSGASTYTGGTSVNAGTLLVNNPANMAAGTGPVIVNSGGTLGGNGTVGDVTVGLGGLFAPGGALGSMGTLTTMGNFTWNSDGSASALWVLSSLDNSSSLLNISGNFIAGADSTSLLYLFDFDGTGFANGTTPTVYNLIDFSNNNGFTPSSFGYVNLASGLSGTFSFGGAGNTELQFSVIPEPADFALGGGVLALLAAGVRRRRRLGGAANRRVG